MRKKESDRTKAFSLRAVPKYSVDCLECIEIFERIEKKITSGIERVI